jgi:hypothetical protein
MRCVSALKTWSLSLESELTKARASAVEDVAALEARVKSAEAHAKDVAAASERHLSDFESELIRDLAELRAFYESNIQSIGGMCSSMPEGEASVMGYIRWLSMEVSDLSDVFTSVNKNFASAIVDDTLAMAGGSVNLATLQASAADSGTYILTMERDV